MLNPFKIYTPVKEIIEDIKESPEKYSISLDGENFIHCFNIENSDWSFSVAPLFVFWVWKSDKIQWTTWAEGWYLYSNIRKIALAKKKPRPQYTREGWKNKLGLEE